MDTVNGRRVVEDMLFRGKRRVIVEVKVNHSCGHIGAYIVNDRDAVKTEKYQATLPCTYCFFGNPVPAYVLERKTAS